MSSTLDDNLKTNYEKALDEGRNALVEVCTVLLARVTVKDYFTGLSKTQKNKFNEGQISQIEAGDPLNKMDISLLNVITRTSMLVPPGNLKDRLKELNDERNLFTHQKQKLSLDKTKLRSKIADLKVLYTAIYEALKKHCDPAIIPSIDKVISDMETRLSILEKTLDDRLHEESEALRKESALTRAMMAALDKNTNQAIGTLNQAVAQAGVNINDSMDQVKSELLLLIETSMNKINNAQIQQQPSVQGDQQQSPDTISQQLNKQQTIQLDLLVQHNDPLLDFVLHTRKYHMDTTNFNPISIIKESADFNGLKVDFPNVSTDSSMQECKLFIGGYLMKSSEGESIKSAKNAAATQALQSLRARCYTLQVLKRHIGKETVTIDSITSIPGTTDSSPKGSSSFRFLKMFVSSDGGLGRKVKAIFEPIKLEAVIGSQGLDMKVAEEVTNQFKQSIAKILQDYVTSDRQDDLIFSPEFTKEQRKEIQGTASYLNLKGKSTGKGNDRFVAISRKDKFEKTNILQEVMKNGGQTEKYKLLKPGEPWFDDE